MLPKANIALHLRQTAASHNRRMSQIKPVRQSSLEKENRGHCPAPITVTEVDYAHQVRESGTLTLSQVMDHENINNIRAGKGLTVESLSIFKDIFQKSSAQRKTENSPESPQQVNSFNNMDSGQHQQQQQNDYSATQSVS